MQTREYKLEPLHMVEPEPDYRTPRQQRRAQEMKLRKLARKR